MASTGMLDALEAIISNRGADYGNELKMLEQWRDMFSIIVGKDINITQAVLIIDAVKTIRLLESPDHMDSIMDKAGYMNVLFNAINQRKEENKS